MKKIMLLICMAGSVSLSVAQSVKWGINAGVNLSSYGSSNTTSGSGYSSITASNVIGFHAGVIAGIDVGQFSIQPGLFYTTKGSKSVTATNEVTALGNYTGVINLKQKLNYLQLPVSILYNLPVKGIGKLFIGGGPYAALALSGNADFTSTTTLSGSPSSTTGGSAPIHFGSDAGEIKKMDYGVNTLLGIAFKNKVSISAGYDIGLAKLSGSYPDKNHVLSFSLGYWFL